MLIDMVRLFGATPTFLALVLWLILFAKYLFWDPGPVIDPCPRCIRFAEHQNLAQSHGSHSSYRLVCGKAPTLVDKRLARQVDSLHALFLVLAIRGGLGG